MAFFFKRNWNLRQKYHDNDFIFYLRSSDQWLLTDATYTISEHAISSGQDPEGRVVNDVLKELVVRPDYKPDVIPIFLGTQATCTVSCGRSKTAPIAKWWAARIAPVNNTFKKTPEELNFALLGTLTLTLNGPGFKGTTFVFNDIALGQGSKDDITNCWFGGKNCKNGSGSTVRTQGTSARGDLVYAEFYLPQFLLNEITISKLSLIPV